MTRLVHVRIDFGLVFRCCDLLDQWMFGSQNKERDTIDSVRAGCEDGDRILRLIPDRLAPCRVRLCHMLVRRRDVEIDVLAPEQVSDMPRATREQLEDLQRTEWMCERATAETRVQSGVPL